MPSIILICLLLFHTSRYVRLVVSVIWHRKSIINCLAYFIRPYPFNFCTEILPFTHNCKRGIQILAIFITPSTLAFLDDTRKRVVMMIPAVQCYKQLQCEQCEDSV